MNWKRIKAVGKLGLLFGTPLLVVLGLFGTGVYVGDLYREPITSFEKEWLGLDVDVAPGHDAPGEDENEDTPEDEPAPKGDENDASEAKDASESKAESAEPAGEVAPKPEPKPEPPAPDPSPTELTPPPAEPPPEVAVPPMTVDPVEGPLATQLATPVAVGVKVLVDDALVQRRPDWIDYVQRTVSRASSVYQKQFGVQLELVSVGRWGVPTEGLSSLELLEDVQARPREAASLVVGFTERPLDDRTSGKAFTPEADAPFNASAAVVYANASHRDAHLRSLLHELGHLFGALDIADARHPDYQSGSWMSYAPVPESQAPWIDAANRARILERKQKPFAPASAPAPAAADPAPEGTTP